MRSSLVDLAVPAWTSCAVTVKAFTFGTLGVGAVTDQLKLADDPPPIVAMLLGEDIALTVQPVGTFSAAVTFLTAGLSVGTLTVAVAVNCWPGLTTAGTCRETALIALAGMA